MRSAVILLAGLALIGAGVAILASDLALRWWLGVPLVAIGLLVKLGGFVLSDDPVRVRRGGRPSTTLDGQVVESPRAGLPAGRSTVSFHPARARRSTAPMPTAAPTRRAS